MQVVEMLLIVAICRKVRGQFEKIKAAKKNAKCLFKTASAEVWIQLLVSVFVTQTSFFDMCIMFTLLS